LILPKPRKVLVVDDSNVSRAAVAKLLSEAGYNVLQAGGGREALCFVGPLKPDVVILDLEMPDFDGAEACRMIRSDSRLRHTPVVMLSVRSDIQARKKALAAGAVELVRKPVTAQTLLPVVGKALSDPKGLRIMAGGKVAESSGCIIPRATRCQFHTPATEFPAFILRARTQIVERNIFDVLVYKEPTPGHDRCNYLLLAVRVCPDCFFASTSDAHFICRRFDPSEQEVLEERFRHFVADAGDQRREIAAAATDNLFSPARTRRDALVAYELAIHSATTLYESSPTRFVVELARAGNYALKAAEIAREMDDRRRMTHYMNRAAELLQQAYAELPVGVCLFRTIYQAAAALLAVGQDRTAAQFRGNIGDLKRSLEGKLDERVGRCLERYTEMTRDLLANCDRFRQEGILPSYG